MKDNIKMPPLPYPYGTPAYRTVGAVIQEYAHAATKAVLQSPEIQALRKDAERYRWLRDGGNDDIGVVMGFDCVDIGSTGVAGTYREGLEGEHLDKAIDASMEKQEEKQEPSVKEWCWRMDWLRHNGFNPANPFLWERSGQAYAKHIKESKT